MARFVQLLLQGMSTVSSTPSGEVLDRYKCIERFPPYKDDSSMKEFLQSLEIEFNLAKVNGSEYKRILISKLSPKAKDICIDLITDNTVGYVGIKDRLLEKTGMCMREAELKLFVNWKEEFRDVDRVDRCRQLKGLVDRFLLGAESVEAVRTRLMTAIYRTGLTKSEQGIMDTRKIVTYTDLSELALTLKGSAITSREEQKGSERSWDTRKTVVRCFKCNKLGHRSFECRTRVTEDKMKPIVFYFCDQPGHKAPDCPKKRWKDNGTGDKSNQANPKSLCVRQGDRPKKCNWVAATANCGTVSGKVNGLQTEFVVDTGAEITVVPGNLVYENQLLPESIEIVGATGVPVCTKLADVEFDVMGKNFVKTVAVASAEMLPYAEVMC